MINHSAWLQITQYNWGCFAINKTCAIKWISYILLYKQNRRYFSSASKGVINLLRLQGMPWGKLIRGPTCPTKFWLFCPPPNCFHLPASLSHRVVCYGRMSPVLLKQGHDYHVHSIHSNNSKAIWMKWGIKPKLRKLLFVPGVCKSVHHFPENRAACLILNTENNGGVMYNHDFQSQPLSKEGDMWSWTTWPAAYLAFNQSWGDSNHPVSSWPYRGHQVPCPVPWSPVCLPPLWSDTDRWPYAPGVCSVTGKSWWILHSWLIEYSFCDSSWDLHNWIPAKSGILLSNSQTIYTIPYWNQPWTDTVFKLELVPRQAQFNQAWLVFERLKANVRDIYFCRTADMSWRTCVVVIQMQSNPIQLIEDSLWDDPWGLHNRFCKRGWVLLSDMVGHMFSIWF